MADLASLAESATTKGKITWPQEAKTLDFAQSLDFQDPVKHLREEFIHPTKASLKKKALDGTIPGVQTNGANGIDSSDDQARGIYFCGNSLGLQPKAVREYVHAQFETWSSIGVAGHFTTLGNSPLAQWQDMAQDCADKSAPIVGALPSEVVIMNSLTANLHMLMASFYRPTATRHKVILEWKPFPSDQYAIESQVRWHQLDPAESMVAIEPNHDSYISTESVLATIDAHADSTALILLPGLQYYSGQLFDIPAITAHARKNGIVVGWDLAHAAGNVPLQLHDWDVDFAVWCNYKYINAGPGAIAGAFVHEKHGGVEKDTQTGEWVFRPRLAGWYGGDKSVRFNMAKVFQPTPGASGYQVSNPSALDLAALGGALSVFGKTSMQELRSKSILLTSYAEYLLDELLVDKPGTFRIITPRNPAERGVQLSVLIKPELLETVSAALKDAGAVCDQRKPDVIRVPPVPLYNSFEDVWKYMDIFRKALQDA